MWLDKPSSSLPFWLWTRKSAWLSLVSTANLAKRVRVREKGWGTHVYRIPDSSNIWLSSSFSGPLHPWPNPPTNHSYTQLHKSFTALSWPAIRLGTHGFSCHCFAPLLGFSILGSHPSSVSWVQFHSFCSCTGDLEYELSSLAPGLQNRIHILGLEPTRVAGPTRRKDLRVRRGGG